MPGPKRLNQSAIAKAAGVSRTTVSTVLQGGEGPSDATKTKVLAIAKRMGYRPNALVHSIRSGKSRSVGILAEPHDSYWRNVCYGLHDRLIEADHLPLFLWNHDNPVEGHALKQIYRLLDRWVDGIILWPPFTELYAEHLHEFQDRNIPLITIDHTVSGIKADVVQSDERQLADLIVTHLAGLGHKVFLIVSGPKGLGWADERYEALAAHLSKLPNASHYELRAPLGPNVVPVVATLVAEALKTHPSVTAVIACTDNIAKSVYTAANQLKLKIPERLSVSGIADLDFAALMSPPLTTVRQDGYGVGRKAAQVELERSTNLLSGPPQHFKLPGTLVIRESTGPVSKAHS